MNPHGRPADPAITERNWKIYSFVATRMGKPKYGKAKNIFTDAAITFIVSRETVIEAYYRLRNELKEINQVTKTA